MKSAQTRQLDNALRFMHTLQRQETLESALLLYQRAGRETFLDLPINEAAAVLADWREKISEYQEALPYIDPNDLPDESEN
jgi:hypothetical protein